MKRNARLWFAGAAIALGSITGCQTPVTQMANPFTGQHAMEPNAMPSTMPASPAFGRVQAGQNLPMMAQQPMMVAPGYPQGMVPQQVMMPAQPVMGSGGMVYPVGYQQGQPQMQMQMAPQLQMQPVMNYAPPAGPATVYTPSAPVLQAPPPVVPTSPTSNLPAPSVQTIQGPNGPITVTTEVFDQMPPASNNGPTFSPAAPVTVAMPEAPNLPPINRAPEMLPPNLSKGPTGPTLPGLNPPAGVGTFPAVPVGHQQVVPATNKLPAPTAPNGAEDDIPSAPIFLPGK